MTSSAITTKSNQDTVITIEGSEPLQTNENGGRKYTYCSTEKRVNITLKAITIIFLAALAAYTLWKISYAVNLDSNSSPMNPTQR